MPSSRAGKRSVRTPAREGEHMHPYSGQLDILCENDGRYPDIKSPRIGTFPGNGPCPPHPHGDRKMNKPSVGRPAK